MVCETVCAARNDVAISNRKNPFLFRDTLLKLLKAEHLEYKELIA